MYLAASALATVWTDFLWFDSLGYAGVWWTRVLVRAALIVGAVSISFLVLFSNLALADRMSLRHLSAPGTEEDELLARLRDWVEPRLRSVRLLGSAVLAVMIGGGAGAWTDRLVPVPESADLRRCRSSLRQRCRLLRVSASAARATCWCGASTSCWSPPWPWQPPTTSTARSVCGRGAARSSPGGAKVHVSVLLAILALFRAGLYQIDAYRLLYSTRSTQFFGAGFTDVSARLPALQAADGDLGADGRCPDRQHLEEGLDPSDHRGSGVVPGRDRRRRDLPGRRRAAAGRAQPACPASRPTSPTISRSPGPPTVSTASRSVPSRPIPIIETEEIEEHEAALSNIRLWDPYVLARANSPQEFREYYGLARVDADRYLIDGEVTQVMLSIRELDESDIEDNWQLRRLSYTHGFGAVASYASRIGLDGQPQYLVSDIPPVATVPELEMDQPRIYFGELQQTSPSPGDRSQRRR